MVGSNKVVQVGIISDTHGLLRNEVVKAFKEVELIIHCGDIDTPEVLDELEKVAPVKAVRGNMDRGAWAKKLPPFDLIEINGISIYALHDLHQLDLDPESIKLDVVVNGHTHRPLMQRKKGILYLNPGSAGYRRNSSPLGISILTIKSGHLNVETIQLDG